MLDFVVAIGKVLCSSYLDGSGWKLYRPYDKRVFPTVGIIKYFLRTAGLLSLLIVFLR